MDLPAMYLWYLVQPTSLKQLSEYVDAQPTFWDLDYRWTNRNLPLWMPGFVAFLAGLPGFKRALKTLDQEFKDSESRGWSGHRFSANSARHLFFALIRRHRGPVKRHVRKLLDTSPINELSTVAVHADRSTRLDSLLTEWSFRPLLFGATCGVRSSRHLGGMVSALKANEPSREPPSNSGQTTLEKAIGKGIPPAAFEDEAAKRILNRAGPMARWVIADSVMDIDVSWRDHFPIESAMCHQTPGDYAKRVAAKGADLNGMASGLLVSACLNGERENRFDEENRSVLRKSSRWYRTRTKAGDGTATEKFKIIARLKGRNWTIQWDGIFKEVEFKVSPKNKRMKLLFKALQSARWDPKDRTAHLNVIDLSTEFFPKQTDREKTRFLERTAPVAQFEQTAKNLKHAKEEMHLRNALSSRLLLDLERAIDDLIKRCRDNDSKKELKKLIEKKGSDIWTRVNPKKVLLQFE